jgi:hypothetical protein
MLRMQEVRDECHSGVEIWGSRGVGISSVHFDFFWLECFLVPRQIGAAGEPTLAKACTKCRCFQGCGESETEEFSLAATRITAIFILSLSGFRETRLAEYGLESPLLLLFVLLKTNAMKPRDAKGRLGRDRSRPDPYGHTATRLHNI